MNAELTKKYKNEFGKKRFRLMNYSVLGKTMKDVRKQRSQACNNQRKKGLFGIRTKLSCRKMIFNKFVSSRNEKTSKNQKKQNKNNKKSKQNKSINEQTSLFSSITIRYLHRGEFFSSLASGMETEVLFLAE